MSLTSKLGNTRRSRMTSSSLSSLPSLPSQQPAIFLARMKVCSIAALLLLQPRAADCFSPLQFSSRSSLAAGCCPSRPRRFPQPAFRSSRFPVATFSAKPKSAMRAVSPFTGDFKTSKGELVDPYRVLKVPRDADPAQIKNAYRDLSRRYHPDGNRHRTILPGTCNNAEDVRDHWERIRVSYEILKSPTLRKRYDRHVVMSDPKAALQRAAVDAAYKGVKSVGQGLFQGIFSAGSFAVEQLTKEKHKKAQESTSNPPVSATPVSSAPSIELPIPTNDGVDALKSSTATVLLSNATTLVPELAP